MNLGFRRNQLRFHLLVIIFVIFSQIIKREWRFISAGTESRTELEANQQSAASTEVTLNGWYFSHPILVFRM